MGRTWFVWFHKETQANGHEIWTEVYVGWQVLQNWKRHTIIATTYDICAQLNLVKMIPIPMFSLDLIKLHLINFEANSSQKNFWCQTFQAISNKIFFCFSHKSSLINKMFMCIFIRNLMLSVQRNTQKYQADCWNPVMIGRKQICQIQTTPKSCTWLMLFLVLVFAEYITQIMNRIQRFRR